MITNISRHLRVPFNVTMGIVAVGLTLAACDALNMKSESASAGAMPSIDQMIAMSMQNMKKVMMMPDKDRAQYVMTEQQTALKHGEQLFGSSRLGTNGFTCATCHPGGDTTGGKVPMGDMQMLIPTLKGAALTFPKYKVPNDAVITLPEMNNNCVVMFLKGQPLPLGSKDSRDLAAYVSYLSQGKAYTPGKQSM